MEEQICSKNKNNAFNNTMNNRPFPEFSEINKQISKFVRTVSGKGGKGTNFRGMMAGSGLAVGLGLFGLGMYIHL
jgi:hypothetical protein